MSPPSFLLFSPLLADSGPSCRPIASLESLYGRQQFKPFLDAGAVDVAIVDILWNGCWESLKIAAMCDAYEVRSSHSISTHSHHLSVISIPSSSLQLRVWRLSR